jgi:hypothetical protein
MHPGSARECEGEQVLGALAAVHGQGVEVQRHVGPLTQEVGGRQRIVPVVVEGLGFRV